MESVDVADADSLRIGDRSAASLTVDHLGPIAIEPVPSRLPRSCRLRRDGAAHPDGDLVQPCSRSAAGDGWRSSRSAASSPAGLESCDDCSSAAAASDPSRSSRRQVRHSPRRRSSGRSVRPAHRALHEESRSPDRPHTSAAAPAKAEPVGPIRLRATASAKLRGSLATASVETASASR